MTANEIIKALEVCVGIHNDCDNCPLLEYSQATDECMTEAMSNALDLINRQKAEIERLQNALFKQEDTMQMIIKERDAEIESLKNDLAKEFTCFVGSPHKVESCPFFDELENERAEAVKEFAERLKERREIVGYDRDLELDIYGSHIRIDIDEFDNLVKETAGED